jgi:hypothetical protein
LNKREKLNLINTLHRKVVDYEADGETCYYVDVILDDETRDVLRKLGKDDQWIDSNAEDNGDGVKFIDITPVGFEFAQWWHSDTGFSLYKPHS